MGASTPNAVRQRAVERGLVGAEAQLSEAETYALIFQPGFSTAEQVTDVSGRGVGMDVVRERVEGLRGTIELASKPGMGARVTLRLPLTLAIIDGLLVSVEDACFVLPLAATLECIELSTRDIEQANGKHVAHVRGEIVPYIRLREHFHMRSPRPELEQIMVVESGEGRFGFVVDQVLGNCQTVIKSLGRFYRHVQAVSGATILGDGRVALSSIPSGWCRMRCGRRRVIRAPGPRRMPRRSGQEPCLRRLACEIGIASSALASLPVPVNNAGTSLSRALLATRRQGEKDHRSHGPVGLGGNGFKQEGGTDFMSTTLVSEGRKLNGAGKGHAGNGHGTPDRASTKPQAREDESTRVLG